MVHFAINVVINQFIHFLHARGCWMWAFRGWSVCAHSWSDYVLVWSVYVHWNWSALVYSKKTSSQNLQRNTRLCWYIILRLVYSVKVYTVDKPGLWEKRMSTNFGRISRLVSFEFYCQRKLTGNCPQFTSIYFLHYLSHPELKKWKFVTLICTNKRAWVQNF